MTRILAWFTAPHRAALVAFAAALGAFLHSTGIVPAVTFTEIAAFWAVVVTGATFLDRVVSGFLGADGSGQGHGL